jgi:hypothetical protein
MAIRVTVLSRIVCSQRRNPSWHSRRSLRHPAILLGIWPTTMGAKCACGARSAVRRNRWRWPLNGLSSKPRRTYKTVPRSDKNWLVRDERSLILRADVRQLKPMGLRPLPSCRQRICRPQTSSGQYIFLEAPSRGALFPKNRSNEPAETQHRHLARNSPASRLCL